MTFIWHPDGKVMFIMFVDFFLERIMMYLILVFHAFLFLFWPIHGRKIVMYLRLLQYVCLSLFVNFFFVSLGGLGEDYKVFDFGISYF